LFTVIGEEMSLGGAGQDAMTESHNSSQSPSTAVKDDTLLAADGNSRT